MLVASQNHTDAGRNRPASAALITSRTNLRRARKIMSVIRGRFRDRCAAGDLRFSVALDRVGPLDNCGTWARFAASHQHHIVMLIKRNTRRF